MDSGVSALVTDCRMYVAVGCSCLPVTGCRDVGCKVLTADFWESVVVVAPGCWVLVVVCRCRRLFTFTIADVHASVHSIV